MISPHIGVGDLKIFNNNKYANFFFGRDMEYSKQKEKKKNEGEEGIERKKKRAKEGQGRKFEKKEKRMERKRK